MAQKFTPQLGPAQIATLERLAQAGFELVTIEHVERYLAVGKYGFVALLEPAAGKLRSFGQAGYRMGDGMGMLVERKGAPVFVWKQETVPATPQLLDAYAKFKRELADLLGAAGEAPQ